LIGMASSFGTSAPVCCSDADHEYKEEYPRRQGKCQELTLKGSLLNSVKS